MKGDLSVDCVYQLKDARNQVSGQIDRANASKAEIEKAESTLYGLYQKYGNQELTFDKYKDRLQKMLEFEVNGGRIPIPSFAPMKLPIDPSCQGMMV
jgi:hypothetical protein